MLYRSFTTVILLTLIALLSSCAVLQPNFQTPEVKVMSVQPGAGTGLQQSFDVGLLVINPNAQPLSLVGMTYAIELEGFKSDQWCGQRYPADCRLW